MAGKDRPERARIPDLVVKGAVVRARLHELSARPATAGPLPEAAETVTTAAIGLLALMDDAAHGRAPRVRRLPNWWRGTLNDVGYRSLHAASAQLAVLFSPAERRAALPEAVSRLQSSGLSPGDPRRLAAQQAAAQPETVDGARLRQLIMAGYEAADDAYARVRSFRNVVLFAALLVTVVGGVFVGYATAHPGVLPLCFDNVQGATTTLVCPSSETVAGTNGPTTGPTAQDVLLVGLLGMLGACLSAAVSLRHLRGSADPYSVPVALTVLKVPTGALTAIVAMIAIQAGFVPGLSALDSQAQILAYALLFGYAQQLVTGLVDRQGASVLAGVPNRAAPVAATPTVIAAAPVTTPVTTVVTEPDLLVGEDDEADEADELAEDELVDDSALDDGDLADLFQQDVSDGGIDDDSGVLEELPDEDDAAETATSATGTAVTGTSATGTSATGTSATGTAATHPLGGAR